MRFKGTILLTLILILLGGYLLWFELPREKKASEAEEREKRVLDIQDPKVTGLVFKNGTEEIELERHPDRPDQKWEVVRPIVGPANDEAAAEALSEIVRLDFSRVVDEKPADLKPYGLDQPDFSVTVVINRTEVEQLQFGANNPIGSEVYLRRRGDKRVLLVGAGVLASLKKPLKEWRRPQIFTEHAANVKEITFTYPDRTLEVSLEGDLWKIKKPKELPGDTGAINGFINSLFTLRADDFIDIQKEEKKASFGKPFLVLGLKILAVDRTVSFYRPASEPGAVYAVTTSEDPIYKLRSSDAGFLNKDVFSLRDKSVIHLANQGEVGEIDVERDGESYTVVRNDGKWVLSGAAPDVKLDDSKISHLLVTLQTAQAEQFVDEPSSEKAGLSSPRVRIVLKDKGGKTIDGLLFGREEGGRLYGRSNGQPAPFLVNKRLLDAVPKKEDLSPKAPAPQPKPGS